MASKLLSGEKSLYQNICIFYRNKSLSSNIVVPWFVEFPKNLDNKFYGTFS